MQDNKEMPHIRMWKMAPFLINGFAYPLLLQHIGNKVSIIMLYTFISKMMACGRIDARHMMKRK